MERAQRDRCQLEIRKGGEEEERKTNREFCSPKPSESEQDMILSSQAASC